MKQLFILIGLCAGLHSLAQMKPADRILYGKITPDSLLQSPYDSWFKKNYDSYAVNPSIENALEKMSLKGISMEVYFGSWCGDSKRELPRFLKLLDQINFDKRNLAIVALGGSDSLYKQSPQGQEKAKGIFKVPVFIVYKNGVEINRINEFPVQTLERDLLSILQREDYSANYHSFSTVSKWLEQGALADSNVSVRGLMNQLKPLVMDEHELNSIGYLLLKQQKIKEALVIFRINAGIFPESANTLSSLGEAYLETGDKQKAISYLERSLGFERSTAVTQEILSLLYKANRL
ncbi:MAG: hypothetical protein EOO13_17895 [Chitinophagaceae bacterium]|nr:MAG: hypothetical protein EOO13_17895 [Chitinophagaceae bacterium]